MGAVLDDESVVVDPLDVAIKAMTIPIAKTLAIAMTVFALLLMSSDYAGRWS